MTIVINEYNSLDMASDSATGNGSTTDYVTSSNIKSTIGVWVSVDGLIRTITTDYTVTLGTNTISFVTAPASGQSINIKYFKRES